MKNIFLCCLPSKPYGIKLFFLLFSHSSKIHLLIYLCHTIQFLIEFINLVLFFNLLHFLILTHCLKMLVSNGKLSAKLYKIQGLVFQLTVKLKTIYLKKIPVFCLSTVLFPDVNQKLFHFKVYI